MISLPPRAVPPGAFHEAQTAVGRQLAVPVRGGGLVSETVLVGDGLLTGSPAGTAALPLRPADPAAARLLSPGSLVDVVAAPEEGFDGAGPPVVLASGVPVLWITGTDSGTTSWPGTTAAADEQLVVVAAPAAAAPELAVASARGGLYFVPKGVPGPGPSLGPAGFLAGGGPDPPAQLTPVRRTLFKKPGGAVLRRVPPSTGVVFFGGLRQGPRFVSGCGCAGGGSVTGWLGDRGLGDGRCRV